MLRTSGRPWLTRGASCPPWTWSTRCRWWSSSRGIKRRCFTPFPTFIYLRDTRTWTYLFYASVSLPLHRSCTSLTKYRTEPYVKSRPKQRRKRRAPRRRSCSSASKFRFVSTKRRVFDRTSTHLSSRRNSSSYCYS